MSFLSKKIQSFFPLYLDIRIRSKHISLAMQMISTILIFLQVTQISLFATRPSLIMDYNGTLSTEVHFLGCALFIPWFFDTYIASYDCVYILILQIIWFILTINGCSRVKNHRTLRNFHIHLILSIEYILTGVLAIPLYFRFALATDCLINDYDPTIIAPMILCALAVVINFFIGYWNSVFLEPFDLVVRCPFDLYEGKYRIVYHIFMALDVYVAFLIHTIQNSIAQYTLVIAIVIISIFDIYIRIIPHTYVSWVYKFFNNIGLVVIPVVSLFRFMFKLNLVLTFVVYIITILLFFIILLASKIYLQSKANQVMAVFVSSSSSSEQAFTGSGLSPFSFVSLLRMCAKSKPVPEIYERLMEMQRTFNRRGSNLIEICRFLGLFPSRRASMIDEIDRTTSNSIHNKFIIYCIRARLSSLVLVSTQEERQSLNRFRMQLVAAMNRYWRARLVNAKWTAFIEFINCYILGTEIMDEAPAMLRRFPFDPSARRLYIECLYVLGGDAMELQNQQNILNELLHNTQNITDPILHSAIKTTPHVMQFLSKEELKVCSSSTKMNVRKPEKLDRPVWSYLAMKQREYFPGPYAFYCLPVLALIIFFIRIVAHEKESADLSVETAYLTNETVFDFALASSSMFTPFSQKDTIDSVYSTPGFDIEQATENECQVILFDVIFHIVTYYQNLGLVRSVVSYSLPYSTTFFRNALNQSDSFCSILQGFLENPTLYALRRLDSPTGAFSTAKEAIDHRIVEFSTPSHYLNFIYEMIGLCVLGTIIFVVSGFLKANRVLNDYKEYFEYLASTDRNNLLNEGKGEEAWEYLKCFIPASSSEDLPQNNLQPLQITPQPSNQHQPSPLQSLQIRSFPQRITNRIEIDVNALAITTTSSEATGTMSHTQTTDEQEKNNSNDINGEYVIDPLTSPLKPARGYLILLLSVLATWFLIVLFAVYVGTHHVSRAYVQRNISENLEATFDLTKTVLSLQYLITRRILNYDIDQNNYYDLYHTLLNSNHAISTYFRRNVTSTINNQRLGSLDYFVKLLITDYSSYDQTFWQITFLPQFFTFTRDCIIESYMPESQSIVQFTDSMVAAFVIIMMFLVLPLCSIGIYMSISFAKVLSRLFIFPVRLIDLSNYTPASLKNEEDDKFPDNALVVRSIAETGQIYSVSQNSLLLLGKKSESLIDTPFSEVFSNVPAEVPLVSTTDKKQEKKTFLIQKKQNGRIVLSVLVDDSTKVMNGTYKEVSPHTQLVGYVPNYFSERFAQENNTRITIEKSYFLIIRIKSSDPKLIERFYGNFSMLIAHFSQLRSIHMDGSLISCVISSILNKDEVLLMVREIITKIGDSVTAFSVVYYDKVEFQLYVDDEPYVACLTKEFKASERLIFTQPEGTISFPPSMDQAKWCPNPQLWNNLYLIPIRQYWLSSIKILSK